MFRKILILFIFISYGTAWSQVSSSSPYSSLGIGDTKYYGNAYINALGGAATALTDSSEVNTYNPSTYSLIASQRPLFSLGLNHYEETFIGSDGQTAKARFTGITHMTIAIPFGNRFGLAFGLRPFSQRGYKINSGETVEENNIQYLYNGKGAIYNVFLGFAANIIENRNHTLSLGANGEYYFGTMENERRAYIESSTGTQSGGMDIKSLHAKSLGFDIGINYNYRPNPEQSFRIAGVYRPSLNAKFDKNDTRIYYGDFYSQASYDTILNTGNLNGKIVIPSKLSVGFTYIYTPSNDSNTRRTKSPSYLFTFEYSKENWSSYREKFDTEEGKGAFVDANSFRFGFQYTPHRFALTRSNYIGFFTRMKYRIGAYWTGTPYQVGGTQILDRGVTLGFGIPILMHRSVSMLNFAFNYGYMNGGKGPNTFNQRYFGVSFGFNIAPGFDRWFQKYKLN